MRRMLGGADRLVMLCGSGHLDRHWVVGLAIGAWMCQGVAIAAILVASGPASVFVYSPYVDVAGYAWIAGVALLILAAAAASVRPNTRREVAVLLSAVVPTVLASYLALWLLMPPESTP